MSPDARLLRVSCRQCGRYIINVRRLGEPELAQLGDHVRQLHPDERLPANAALADVLQHYLVDEEDG